MRKVKGVPDDIMMEIDFMIGSIEECNSEYLLPILKEHSLDPKGLFLFIDSVSDEVIVDIYEKLFKSGMLEPFYTVEEYEEYLGNAKETDKNTPTLNSDSIKEMFPDWAEIEPGMWSIYSKCLTYGLGHDLEIGLYREPLDSGEYARRYTLQVFDGDSVVFCADVDDQR